MRASNPTSPLSPKDFKNLCTPHYPATPPSLHLTTVIAITNPTVKRPLLSSSDKQNPSALSPSHRPFNIAIKAEKPLKASPTGRNTQPCSKLQVKLNYTYKEGKMRFRASHLLWVLLFGIVFLAFGGQEASAETGLASWYSPDPANAGEYAAAHKTLPLGTVLTVSYGGRSVEVTVTDRGPYVGGRELDLSQAAAQYLGLTQAGVDYVHYTYGGEEDYGGDQPAPSNSQTSPSVIDGSYTVQPGDTLYSIASRLDTSVESLAAANSIADPDLLHEGRVLTIPQESGPSYSSGYPQTGWHPASDYNYTASNRPGSHPVNKIIVHTTQGSPQSALNHFADPASGASAHYTVSSEGGSGPVGFRDEHRPPRGQLGLQPDLSRDRTRRPRLRSLLLHQRHVPFLGQARGVSREQILHPHRPLPHHRPLRGTGGDPYRPRAPLGLGPLPLLHPATLRSLVRRRHRWVIGTPVRFAVRPIGEHPETMVFL